MAKDSTDDEFKRQMKAYCKQFKGQPGMEDAMKNMCISDSSDDEADRSHPQSISSPTMISSSSRGAVGVGNAATPSRAGIEPRLQSEQRNAAVDRRSRPEQVCKLFTIAVPTCLVRQREDLKSAELGRLQEGTVVKALEQRGSRLRYCKVHGEGPVEGWISIAVGGKQILCDVPETPGAASSHSNVSSSRKTPDRNVHLSTSAADSGSVTESEKAVTTIHFRVCNATDPACNGVYRYDGNFKGKPMYKQSTGAVIFFNGVWRMNSIFKVSSWLYSWDDSDAALPPEGVWRADDALGGSADLECCGERLRVISEKGAHLKLENGSTVPKTLEYKSWRWCANDGEDQHMATRSQAVSVNARSLEHSIAREESHEDVMEDVPSLADILAGIEAAESSSRAETAQVRSTERSSARAAGLDTNVVSDDVPSLEELLAGIDAAESAETAQADFFALGRATSSALMNTEAGLQGSITTGRGSAYTFIGLRDLGASLAFSQSTTSTP